VEPGPTPRAQPAIPDPRTGRRSTSTWRTPPLLSDASELTPRTGPARDARRPTPRLGRRLPRIADARTDPRDFAAPGDLIGPPRAVRSVRPALGFGSSTSEMLNEAVGRGSRARARAAVPAGDASGRTSRRVFCIPAFVRRVRGAEDRHAPPASGLSSEHGPTSSAELRAGIEDRYGPLPEPGREPCFDTREAKRKLADDSAPSTSSTAGGPRHGLGRSALGRRAGPRAPGCSPDTLVYTQAEARGLSLRTGRSQGGRGGLPML